MGIIATILAGLIIGLLAKWVVPGRDPGGIMYVIGAAILLIGWRIVKKNMA